MDREYESLLNLLDDENEQSAAQAMAELLQRDEKPLQEILRKLQESSNGRLRKRIHQLQGAILLRKRRSSFSEKLKNRQLDLLEGLIQLHLLWFDNDSRAALNKQWDSFLKESVSFHPDTLESLGMFLRKKQLRCTNRDDIQASHYCLGTLLDESEGSDCLLCAVAVLTAAKAGLNLRVTQSAESDFILLDSAENILLPANDWEYVPFDQVHYRFDFWSVPMLLRYALGMMFTCAVSSDSFRYVHTIGNILLPGEDPSGSNQTPDYLPYPYGTHLYRKK